MRKIFLLIFIPLNTFLFSQVDQNNGFSTIPAININELLKKINPSENYTDWAFVHYDFKSNKIIFKRGIKKLSPTRSENDYYGFFPCVPDGCYSYFYAVNRNNKPEYITDTNQVIKFFGKIDCMEESLFIAMLNNYSVDEDYEKRNIYKEFKDEFILYLSKTSYSPYKKEAFIITVKKSGEFSAKSDGVYMYDKNVHIDI
ncbi:hypothetical protein N0B16_11330 [Chryseobacterium sp. GMJ5]|uniref:Uncharacterized protein n=1 Tax=Chryseobacterium gilvum TaxID=2976534 RepID=A0ABT2VZ65_9FLAO|nr:hypothetical protein [Chryseobacterium gilvum]MCU7615030.1 hypothetical protein [Chryseobacterium gilvum]